MNITMIYKNYLKQINPLFFGILLLLVFSVFYYFFTRESTRQQMDATLLVGPYPYWMENSVRVGDQDKSAYGLVNATVLEKESYEAGGNGKSSIVKIRISLVLDRTGVYLYKSKPVAIGSQVNLRLPLVDLAGMIMSMEKTQEKLKDEFITLNFINKGYSPEQLTNIQKGSRMETSKGRVLAEIMDFQILPHEVRSDTSGGQARVSFDSTKRDLRLTARLLVNRIDDHYYFLYTKKIKKGETVDLFFKDYTLWKLVIDEVSGELISP